MVASEDDPESWRQVAALGSMAGLLKDQRSRLEVAKQKLIEAWPPEKNKASAAFVEMIDNLLFTMQKNKEIADSNAGALSQILEALRQAKKDIAPLYREYLEKSDDWVPGWWDNAEDELDEQARARMRAAEVVIAHPDNAIKSPGRYEFAPGEFVSQPIGTGGDIGRGGAVSPFGVGGIGGAGGFEVPHAPPPALPGTDSPVQSPSGPGSPPESRAPSSGPDLAAVITPTPGGAPSAPPIAPSISAGSPLGQPAPGLVIGGTFPTGVPGSGVPGGRGGVTPFGVAPPHGGSGLPGGGRGGLSPAKPVPPSWLPPASGQPPRGGAGGRARTGGSAPMPMAGGRQTYEGHYEGTAFDPDSPWSTAEGVPPVIEPSRRCHRHDPGPGVIGWRG